MSQVSDTTARIMEYIDKATEPPMSKRKAVEVIETVIEECRFRIEGLNDEIKEAGNKPTR
jgi:hypothetical protein